MQLCVVWQNNTSQVVVVVFVDVVDVVDVVVVVVGVVVCCGNWQIESDARSIWMAAGSDQRPTSECGVTFQTTLLSI